MWGVSLISSLFMFFQLWHTKSKIDLLHLAAQSAGEGVLPEANVVDTKVEMMADSSTASAA